MSGHVHDQCLAMCDNVGNRNPAWIELVGQTADGCSNRTWRRQGKWHFVHKLHREQPLQPLLHKCNTSQIDRFGAAQQNNRTTLRVTCGFFFEAKHLKTDIVAHQLSPFFTDVFCSNQSAFVSAPALRPPLLRQFAKITNGDVVHAWLLLIPTWFRKLHYSPLLPFTRISPLLAACSLSPLPDFLLVFRGRPTSSLPGSRSDSVTSSCIIQRHLAASYMNYTVCHTPLAKLHRTASSSGILFELHVMQGRGKLVNNNPGIK